MIECGFSGCDKSVKSNQLCSGHAEQSRLGRTLAPLRKPINVGRCQFAECVQLAKYTGLCVGHYTQQRRGRELSPLRKQAKKYAGLLRDVDGNKLCHACKKWQSTNNFSAGNNRHDGLQFVCKACTRKYNMVRKYNISMETYLNMLDAQDGKCALCKAEPTDVQPLAVDHDHRCCPAPGKSCGRCVRKLLCFRCNAGIGLLRDDPALLRVAADYLEGF